MKPSQPDPTAAPLGEIARLFLRLGFTAFGGPAAHIAMLRREVVERLGWLTDQEFLDLLGATNLIPGPNSTEMAIHVGLKQAGWRGWLVAGACFILPATAIVLGFAWLYTRYGNLPSITWLLYGVKPVIIAVVVQAFAGLGAKAFTNRWSILIAAAAFGAYFLKVNEILILFTGGLALMVLNQGKRILKAWMLIPFPLITLRAGPILAGLQPEIATILWIFLRIGSVLYGSGYVLLAFLRTDFVERLGWLTDAQLLDAIIVGQVTPGPVFTTATFIGYVLAGLPGALAATVGIFLPAFVFVALSQPLIPRLRNSPWASSFLDGIIAASLGLMAGVTLLLARDALVDPLTLALALLSGWFVFRTRVNTTWLILLGAIIGILYHLLTTR